MSYFDGAAGLTVQAAHMTTGVAWAISASGFYSV